MPERAVIITKAFDLLKELIPTLEKLPRSQRFLLGDRIQNLTSDLLEAYLEAAYTAKAQKLPILQEQNIRLQKLRLFLRLGFELGHYNSKTYHRFAERLDELGRMNGGWIKNLEKRVKG